jgi:hypothetical protein
MKGFMKPAKPEAVIPQTPVPWLGVVRTEVSGRGRRPLPLRRGALFLKGLI